MTDAPRPGSVSGASPLDRVRAAISRGFRAIRTWVGNALARIFGRGDTGVGSGGDLGAATDGAYAALGDSFSSGEGAGSYLPGTDTEANRCHRSRLAYPMLVYGAQEFAGPLRFVACSGAAIAALSTDNPDRDGEGPQLDAVTDDASLVTLTVGGNDLGFSEVLTSCAQAPGSCQATWDPILDARTAALEADLAAAYAALLSRAPAARIIVLGYPRLFPVDPAPLSGMAWLFGLDNLRWMNERADALNAALAAAADAAGVEFVDPTAAFTGHAVGDADPYLNDLDLFGSDGTLIDSSSFHPNAAGQAAYARLLLG